MRRQSADLKSKAWYGIAAAGMAAVFCLTSMLLTFGADWAAKVDPALRSVASNERTQLFAGQLKCGSVDSIFLSHGTNHSREAFLQRLAPRRGAVSRAPKTGAFAAIRDRAPAERLSDRADRVAGRWTVPSGSALHLLLCIWLM
jgi:hypothetical protein